MAIGGSWEQQGRQAHGWFGHGTSAQPRETGQSRSDDKEIATARARDVIHGVVGHQPAARRKAYEAYLAHGGLIPTDLTIDRCPVTRSDRSNTLRVIGQWLGQLV